MKKTWRGLTFPPAGKFTPVNLASSSCYLCLALSVNIGYFSFSGKPPTARPRLTMRPPIGRGRGLGSLLLPPPAPPPLLCGGPLTHPTFGLSDPAAVPSWRIGWRKSFPRKNRLRLPPGLKLRLVMPRLAGGALRGGSAPPTPTRIHERS